MSSNEKELIRQSYEQLCLDLNMDKETSLDGWNSYENLLHHYVLEGDQLHWLAVSLYISCRRNDLARKCDNNPISIDRLLKSANQLPLLIFFDKLHKWEDMGNLTDEIRNKIDQVENAFHISSCIYQKYPKMFVEIFGGNEKKILCNDYEKERKVSQINPKLNYRSRQKKCSHEEFYSLGWTLFSLAKTIYPSIFNDLLASFHLLIGSIQYLYNFAVQMKLDHFIEGSHFNELSFSTLENPHELKVIEILCRSYGGNEEMALAIYEEHFQNEIFEKHFKKIFLNEENPSKIIREMNRFYDEIVLRNCIIDERIFLEKSFQLNDFCNQLNENRNQKLFSNRTPLTANQIFSPTEQKSNSSQGLTPISQAKQLIQQLFSIIGSEQQLKPSKNLQDLLQQQTFLDHLMEKIAEWKNIYHQQYEFIQIDSQNEFSPHSTSHCRRLDFNSQLNSSSSQSQQQRNSSNCSERYFQIALKLFYRALEKIFLIEKKRLNSIEQTNQQIQQSFHKLILNNEFLKSLLGLCLLLVFYAHGENSHDYSWIFSIYSLHGYSFLKIIQIFLKTLKEFNETRSFIKFLSKIEEIILSSMVWTEDSSFWIDLEKKGFLHYQQVFPTKQSNSNLTPTNLTGLYTQSPSKNAQQVSRKLFHQSQTTIDQSSIGLKRYQSDPIVENCSPMKMSPYTMFYRKFYELVLCRLDLLCLRLFGNQSNQSEEILWNFFLFLFEFYSKDLFRSRDLDQILLAMIYFYSNSNSFPNSSSSSLNGNLTWTRLIQVYKSMPNSRLKIVRSVFIRKASDGNCFQSLSNENPSLTPSKPAGTIHLINGNSIGDIQSFYKEIFLTLPNLQLNLQKSFSSSNSFVSLPQRNKSSQIHSMTFNEKLTLHLSSNVSCHYSSQQIHSNEKNSSLIKSNSSILNHSTNSSTSTNVLSSSIQAGHHNRVQTTRTRTIDGKFLTTISTISKSNENVSSSLNSFDFTRNENENERNLFFGQTNHQSSPQTNPIKRTLSNDSPSLASLTKKVLIIENDRMDQQSKQQ